MTDLHSYPALVPGQLPYCVRTQEDVLAEIPATLKRGDSQPVTEALVECLTLLLLECQAAGSYAAAQCDPGRATGVFLEGLGRDRKVTRADSEAQETYRERIFAEPGLASLKAIRDAVNNILAPYTTTKCRVVEAILDRWFVQSEAAAIAQGDEGWHSFIGATPRYPERFYEADAEINDGDYIESADPTGAQVFALKDRNGIPDRKGRHFHVIVPDLSYLNDEPAFVWGNDEFPRAAPGDPIPSNDPRLEVGMFVGSTQNPNQAAFINACSTSALDIYQAIADEVDRICGHSMRWTMFADPRL